MEQVNQEPEVMKNIPEKIYLQVDADGELPEDFKELEVSWSSNKIYDTDIEYVLATSLAQRDSKIWDAAVKWRNGIELHGAVDNLYPDKETYLNSL